MSAFQNYVAEASKKLSDMGKRTGLMVSIGEKESYIVPIYETFVVNHAIINFEITGEVITKYFNRLSIQDGTMRTTGGSRNYLITQRNRNVYIALDPEKETDKTNQSSYMAAECIFNPQLVGKDSEGLDEAIMSVLKLCEVNFRRGLVNNIVVYGPAVFRGLIQRLKLEIQKKFQGSIEVNVSSV